MTEPRTGELLVEVHDGVGRLTLNRPEKRNALNAALVGQLSTAVAELDHERGVKVVTIHGAGEDFCAGADLAEIERIASGSIAENLANADALGALFLQMRRCSKPVVAVVHGRALAGGCGLASACDLVLAGESARFGFPEVRIGFVPAMVMAILRRNVGEKRAFELVGLGETVSAAAAQRIGLVNRVFPDRELEARASEFVHVLAQRSATALQLTKRLLYQQDGMGFEAGIRAGADVNVVARLTEDARAGIAAFTRSAFREEEE